MECGLKAVEAAKKNGAWEFLDKLHGEKMNSKLLTGFGYGITFHIYTTRPANAADRKSPFTGFNLRAGIGSAPPGRGSLIEDTTAITAVLRRLPELARALRRVATTAAEAASPEALMHRMTTVLRRAYVNSAPLFATDPEELWRRGQALPDLARPHGGPHRSLGDARPVIGDQINQLVPAAAEFLGRHGGPSRRT